MVMNKVSGGRVPGDGMMTHGRGGPDPPPPRRSATELIKVYTLDTQNTVYCRKCAFDAFTLHRQGSHLTPCSLYPKTQQTLGGKLIFIILRANFISCGQVSGDEEVR